jgi:hypothetical protein
MRRPWIDRALAACPAIALHAAGRGETCPQRRRAALRQEARLLCDPRQRGKTPPVPVNALAVWGYSARTAGPWGVLP